MKSKKSILIFILISFIALTVLFAFVIKGNFFRYNDISSMVVEPKSYDILINGTWRVKDTQNLTDDIVELSDDELYITNNFISFKGKSLKSPDFKFRYLNSKNYLLSNGIVSDKVIFNSDEVVVVSVSNKSSFYQEFVVIDENTIAAVYNKVYYVFEKVADTVPNGIEESSNKIEIDMSNMDKSFLIGLKSSTNSDVDYSTVLIRKETSDQVSINMINGIFINNNNKFILVNSDGNNISVDDDYVDFSNTKYLQSTNSIINFLSPEYISLETLSTDKSKKNYEIHKLRELENGDKLSIKDIASDSGVDSYFESLRKLGFSASSTTNSDLENIGIKRNNGKWVFKTFYTNFNSDNLFLSDINLDLIPMVSIFENTGKKISKSEVRTKIGEFIDYFISPDETLIVVLTNDDLSVYGINNKNISTLPLANIKLEEKKDIVSYQWKTSYSSKLTYDEFLKIKQLDVKRNI